MTNLSNSILGSSFSSSLWLPWSSSKTHHQTTTKPQKQWPSISIQNLCICCLSLYHNMDLFSLSSSKWDRCQQFNRSLELSFMLLLLKRSFPPPMILLKYFLVTPSDLHMQSSTCSQYKHHNTAKFLVACTPKLVLIVILKLIVVT